MKRSERGSADEIISPDHKQPRGDKSDMASSSSVTEETHQEELEEAEPNLKDIRNLFKNIQGAIVIIQGTITVLVKDNSILTKDVSELRQAISKTNSLVTKLQQELKNQNKYVASLEIGLNRVKKAAKQQRENIEDLQVSLEELEQYSRMISLEIHGILEDIEVETDEVVCKVVKAVEVEMTAEKIEISHRLYRKQGLKPIIAKIANHKGKTNYSKLALSLRI